MTEKTKINAMLFEALQHYENEVNASTSLSKTTKRTYIHHARSYTRWLTGTKEKP